MRQRQTNSKQHNNQRDAMEHARMVAGIAGKRGKGPKKVNKTIVCEKMVKNSRARQQAEDNGVRKIARMAGVRKMAKIEAQTWRSKGSFASET